DSAGEPTDVGTETPGRRKFGDRVHAAPAQPFDEVGEDHPDVDGGELVGVAGEHEPGLWGHPGEQPGHQGQRYHRRLVDDDDVVGHGVVLVVPVAASGRVGEQPVDGRGG